MASMTGLAVAAVVACSSSSDAPSSPSVDGGDAGNSHDGATGDSGPAGGPVSGETDRHCFDDAGTKTKNPTNPASCHPDASGTGEEDGGAPEYGEPMYNSSADDDDCKYGLSWTSTPIYENTDVYFTVVATNAVDGTPATGAKIRSEVYLDETHPSPSADPPVVENPPGTYKSGPIRFDAPGKWAVRFHLHEDCADLLEDSPHGHAAFFVQVP